MLDPIIEIMLVKLMMSSPYQISNGVVWVMYGILTIMSILLHLIVFVLFADLIELIFSKFVKREHLATYHPYVNSLSYSVKLTPFIPLWLMVRIYKNTGCKGAYRGFNIGFLTKAYEPYLIIEEEV